MKRLIALNLAALLGLVLSQPVTDAGLVTKLEYNTLQSDFIRNSNKLAMPWDNATLATNAASC